MKNCPNCNNMVNDADAFCTACGYRFPETVQEPVVGVDDPTILDPAPAPGFNPDPNPNPNPNPNPPYPPYSMPVAPAIPAVDPHDHTAEFNPKDISDNKVFAMLGYLTGIFGVIIALLACNDSPYTRFHATQALKLTICNTLISIVTAILCWTLIVPLAGSICIIILFVIRIICFFSVCSGKAKEPAIICNLGFLK